MDHRMLTRAEKFSKLRRRRRIWTRLVSFFGCVVVFCTTYALILPAITQEKVVETFCNIEEHSHGEDCYAEISPQEEKILSCTYETLNVHQHQPSCYDENGRLLCREADYVLHTHDEHCMDAAGQLVCTLEQIELHEHTELCYQLQEGHAHTAACYTQERGELVCTLPEQHTHDDGCFAGEATLICSLAEEHTHTDTCYTDHGPLVCGYSHVHGDSCYVPGDKLICDQGHAHTDACYAVPQDTLCAYAQEHTHTGDCYAYSVQMHCGQEEDHTHSQACYAWERKLICGGQEHGHVADCYGPGALICGHEQNHTHGDSCYEAQRELTCEQAPHSHADGCFDGESLTCTAAEHEHADGCYAPHRLICTKVEGHEHQQDCREQVLQCQTPVHAHSEDCYAAPELTCKLAEGHKHTDACRELVKQCQQEEHVHEASCYGAPVLTCGRSDEHVHTEACYEPVLACGEGDHVHVESCYGQRELLCQEAEQHVHDAACYQQELLCQKVENHTHEDACYTLTDTLTCTLAEAEELTVLVCSGPQAHTHSEACYEKPQKVLTCMLPEDEAHQHGKLCYGEWELKCEQAEHTHALSCFSDPAADVENEAAWKRTFAHVKLTGIWNMDVLAIAESQLGYKESTKNYIVLEDGESTRGYTRYGAWIGDPYGDWSASFAAFCLHYAKVTGMPIKSDCQRWVSALSRSEADLFRSADDYTPTPGDLVFFDFDEDHQADHVGFVTKASGQLETIEGDSNDRVRTMSYDRDDPAIVGYGLIPKLLNQETAAPEETPLPEATEHVHTESCYDEQGSLICAPAETAAPEETPLPEATEHVHTESCYDEQGSLICAPAETAAPEETPLPEATEHVHTESCYDEQGSLICEFTEAPDDGQPAPEEYFCGLEEHTHVPECLDAEGNPTCGQPEHAHAEACLVEPVPVEYFCGLEAHTHKRVCYGETGELACGLQEHMHTNSCLVQLTMLSRQARSTVEEVIRLIEALPSADQIEAMVMKFEAAGDYEGEEAWMTQTVKDVLWAYQQYSSLPAHLQELVVGREKLLELEFIWSAMTLDIDYVGKTAAFSTDLVLNSQHKIVIYTKYTEETADGGKIERYYAIDYNGNAVLLNIDVNGNITASVSDISTLHWTFTLEKGYYVIQNVAKQNPQIDPSYLHPFDNGAPNVGLMSSGRYGCTVTDKGDTFTFTGNNNSCHAILVQTDGQLKFTQERIANSTTTPEYYIGVFKEPVYVGDEVSFSYEALKSPTHFVIYTQDAEGNYYAFDSTGKAVPLFTDGTGRLRADVSDIFSLHWMFSQENDTKYFIQNVLTGDTGERQYIHPFYNSEDDYGVMTKGKYTSNVALTDGGFTLEGNGYYAKLNLTSMQFEPTNLQEEASVFHVGRYPICYIWYDGTDGGLMSLTGSPDQGTTLLVGSTTTLPATWDSPDKYDYTLRGWYDVINGEYYEPGAEITVTDHMVLYADWRATTYDIGQSNDKVSDKVVSTSDFITTRIYDYSSMINMPYLQPEVTFALRTHKEVWSFTGQGTDIIFVDYDERNEDLSFPVNWGRQNENGEPYHGLYNQGTINRLFGRDDDDSVMGREYIGKGDYLFSYGTDPADDEHFGYYYYNSRLNAASYNKSHGRFYVYNYLERTTDSDGRGVGGYTDFLPFNSPYANANGNPPGNYDYQGESGEYAGVPHYLYDAKGGGSNNATNYWFGMTMDIKFFLPNQPGTTDAEGNYGNQSVYGDDLIFQFAGDDDVWVMVDGKLVLDVGGIHGVRGGDDTINFSKGTVGATASDVLRNLKPGEHTLTMYYLERGSSQSNCSIRFNICPRYGMLLRKEDVLSGEKLNGAQFAVYTDKACTEPAELWPNEAAHDDDEPSNNILTVTDGEGYIWGFAAGNVYYLKEIKGPDEKGYLTPSGVIKMTGNNRGTATFEVLPDEKNELTGGLTVHASSVNHATKEISLTVTNGKNISETTEIYVEKRWEDTKDHTADEVIMSLKADGTVIREQALHSGNDWKFTWTNMPKYHEDGTTEIVYTVVEGEVEGYIGRVSRIEPYAASSWQSADSFADGGLFLLKTDNGYLAADEGGLKWISKEATARASAAAMWQATFNGGSSGRMVLTNKIGLTLRYDATTPAFYASNRTGGSMELSFDGAHISCGGHTVGSLLENGTMAADSESLSFTLEQDTPLAQPTSGYAYRAVNRPNTSEETVSLTVKKAWEPGHFGAGLNYDQMVIDVQLLANGVNSGITRRLSKANGWQETFTHLRAEDDEGQPIRYTVEELGLTGPWLPVYGEVLATEDGYETTITNVCTLTYQLPATGGTGTGPYTWGGILLLAAGVLLLYIKTKRKEGRSL